MDGQRRVLGTDLVGSYLYGSAATGAFEPGVSDLDTVAVLRSDPTESQLAGLPGTSCKHRSRVARVGRSGRGRVPVDPCPHELHDSITCSSDIPRRTFPSDRGGWPVAHRLVPVAHRLVPVAHRRQRSTVRRWLRWRRSSRKRSTWKACANTCWTPSGSMSAPVPGDRSSAILSMCRGLRTCRTGEHVSKREGARWASQLMPEHSALIEDAVAWRARQERSGNLPMSREATPPLRLGRATPLALQGLPSSGRSQSRTTRPPNRARRVVS